MSIYDKITDAPQETLRGADQDPLYECPPRVDKPHWTALGDLIAFKEREHQQPRSDQCYTLRLDITGMSTLKQRLVTEGTFTSRWDPEFSNIMKAVAHDLTRRYQARWCYTQSDEITLVIAPPPNSPRFQHYRGGKLQKLVSLAAARASAVATTLLNHLRERRRAERAATTKENAARVLQMFIDSETAKMWWPRRLFRRLAYYPLVPTDVRLPQPAPMQPLTLEFDCRMAVWNSPREAFMLVLWRAYDCGVNGVSDAVYNERGQKHESAPGGPAFKVLMGASTWTKLKWLERAELLPLPPHQAYGTLMGWRTVTREGVDPRTGERVPVERSDVVLIPVANVIAAVQRGDIPL
jgi:hypothetical protein